MAKLPYGYRETNALLQIDPTQRGQGVVQSYVPDAMDQVAQWMNSSFYGDDREGYARAQNVINSVGYTPLGASEVLTSGKDVITRGLEGDAMGAGLAAGNALLSAGMAPPVARAAAEAAPGAARGLARNARALAADERGTFGGKLADKYPRHMEPLANKMWDEGKSMEEIFDATGLFPTIYTRKYVDQGLSRDEIPMPEWQFEIDDSVAQFKELPKSPKAEDFVTLDDEGSILETRWPEYARVRKEYEDSLPKKLGEYMDHPELYANYPELADNPLNWDFSSGGGSYMPTSSWREESPITLGLKRGGHDVRLTTLHETQHALQNIEGFAGGAHSIFMRPSGERLLSDRIKEATRKVTPSQMARESGYDFDSLSPESQASFEKAAKDKNEIADMYLAMGPQALREKWHAKTASEAYKRSAGETEANNVMERYKDKKDLKLLEDAANAGVSLYDPETDLTFDGMDMPAAISNERARLQYPWQTEGVKPRNQLIDQERFKMRRPADVEPEIDIFDSLWAEPETNDLSKAVKYLKR
jgi:hypothetical protein